MRKAMVSVHGIPAGFLVEIIPNQAYQFQYLEEYQAAPVSLTMPVDEKKIFF